MQRILLAAVALTVCGTAHAQIDRRQADQVFIANSGPRGEVTYKAGDTVLRVPLVWEKAARLGKDVTVTAGDRTVTLTAGTILPLEGLLERQDSRKFFLAYCTPNKQIMPRVTGDVSLGRELGSMLWRSMTDGQTCLADRDRDGSFEQSMVVGAGWGDERTPRTIEPVGYERLDDAPISPKDEVRIRLTGVSATTATFILDIVQRGTALTFDQVGDGSGATDRKTKVPIAQGLPIPMEIYGASFEILAVDPRAKTVTIHWPEGASLRVRKVIPDTVEYTRR
jgi:hypothetical protein